MIIWSFVFLIWGALILVATFVASFWRESYTNGTKSSRRVQYGAKALVLLFVVIPAYLLSEYQTQSNRLSGKLRDIDDEFKQSKDLLDDNGKCSFDGITADDLVPPVYGDIIRLNQLQLAASITGVVVVFGLLASFVFLSGSLMLWTSYRKSFRNSFVFTNTICFFLLILFYLTCLDALGAVWLVRYEKTQIEGEATDLSKVLVDGWNCRCYSKSTGAACSVSTQDKVYAASVLASRTYSPLQHKNYTRYANEVNALQGIKTYRAIGDQSTTSTTGPPFEWSLMAATCFTDFEDGVCDLQKTVREFLNEDTSQTLRYLLAFAFVGLTFTAMAFVVPLYVNAEEQVSEKKTSSYTKVSNPTFSTNTQSFWSSFI